MYDIKEVIHRLKKVANLDSNIQLAHILNVSYNTLNTWIKRAKIPQEHLLEFCNKYNVSLDYILFNQKSQLNIKENSTSTLFNNNTFKYFGTFNQLNIKSGSILTLNKESIHSNAYYLIKKNNIFAIYQVEADLINDTLNIINLDNTKSAISLEEFNKINLGMIVEISKE